MKVSMEFQGDTVSGNGDPQRGYGLFLEKPDASIGKKMLDSVSQSYWLNSKPLTSKTNKHQIISQSLFILSVTRT